MASKCTQQIESFLIRIVTKKKFVHHNNITKENGIKTSKQKNNGTFD
jgi:hypothetical protein